MSRTHARPILLTGSHRSGSTWVGQMIASHPSIGYVEEPFNAHMRPECPVRHMWHHVTEEDADVFRNYVQGVLDFQTWAGKRPGDLTPPRRLAEAAFHALLARWRRLRGARPLLKDPIAFFSAEWLAATFGMQVIVLVRHPAAFVSSIKRLGWNVNFANFLSQPRLLNGYLGPFADEVRRLNATTEDVIPRGTLMWRIIHQVALDYRARHPDWIFVRHEDLSLRPLDEFRALFGRLGLEFTPHVRRTIEAHSSAANASEAPAGTVHQLHRDSRANVWNWSHRLRPEEVAHIREGTEAVARALYPEPEWWAPAGPARRSA
jgi:hypothetical protein